MKKKRIHRWGYYGVLFGVILLCIFVGLAATGTLSDDTRKENRNIFGGTGTVHRFPTWKSELNPMFYDDSSIYYEKQESKRVLYAYDYITGKERTVCARVLCEHDTPDCNLHYLYDSSFLYYWVVDDAFYYTVSDEERVHLYHLDVLTGESEEVYDFPAYEILTDEAGMEIKAWFSLTYMERINPDTILLFYGGELYLFDNQFSLKKRIYCGTGISFTWTENLIFWQTLQGLWCYDIEGDRVEQNVLQPSSGQRVVLSSPYYHYYKDRIYFTTGTKLMVYHVVDRSMEELCEVSFPVRATLLGTEFFFHNGTLIESMDLETGKRTEYPFLQGIPQAKTEKYIIECNALELRIHTVDGRRVFP